MSEYPEAEQFQAPWFEEGKGFVLPPKITPHPGWIFPRKLHEIQALIEKVGEYDTARAAWDREELIRNSIADPLNFGFEPVCWPRADDQWEHCKELLILGGNRSSKTFYMAKRVMYYMVKYPGVKVWCFSQTEDVSNQVQQPYLYHFLPEKWKKARKSKVTNITYSIKGGFTENVFVLPNGSTCRFKFYAQGIQTCEGPETDIIWCDEEVPLSFLETLEFRLPSATRIWEDGGRMFVSFTPVDGYTATIKACLTGAKLIEEADAPLLARDNNGTIIRENVPLVQEGHRGRIVYFHTSENPWSGYKRMESNEFAKASREKILCRAYGVPTKPVATLFPRFREHVHVYPRKQVYDMLRSAPDITWFHGVDPAGGRNWFMLWLAMLPDNTGIVVREYPQQDDYVPRIGFPGAWAIPGEKPDGAKGPAQRSWGFQIQEYMEEIMRVETELAEELERDITVFERTIDSRSANTPIALKEGTTTLLQEVNDWIAENGWKIEPEFDLASGESGVGTTHGKKFGEGISLINNRLAWVEDAPITPGNRPKLIFCGSDDENDPHGGVANTRFSIAEYTGLDGQKGACKDPIDVLRGLLLKQAEYVSVDEPEQQTIGSY